MRPNNNACKVYLYGQPTDMRKQIDGLAAIAQMSGKVKLNSNAMFAFINKRRDKVKILFWEKNGFVVWYKRLEKDRFQLPKNKDDVTLTVKQLNMLLDGYDIFKFKPHEKIPFNLSI